MVTASCAERRRLQMCLAAALVSWAAAGCGMRSAPVAVPIRVEVPVAAPMYCEPPAMGKPALPIASLGDDSAPADTIRAYAETVAILKGALEQRDLVLAGCAKPARDRVEKGARDGN